MLQVGGLQLSIPPRRHLFAWTSLIGKVRTLGRNRASDLVITSFMEPVDNAFPRIYMGRGETRDGNRASEFSSKITSILKQQIHVHPHRPPTQTRNLFPPYRARCNIRMSQTSASRTALCIFNPRVFARDKEMQAKLPRNAAAELCAFLRERANGIPEAGAV